MARKSVLAAFVIFLALALAACGKEKQAEMESEETHGMHSDTQMSAGMAKLDSTVIRRGTIDLAQVDVNGDGNVYQCPMDWNVLADSAGYCPICNMELEQYSVADAKKNLIENNYQVR